jgi:anti-sigma regulatory factor (Ser/Thr protein kinase)
MDPESPTDEQPERLVYERVLPAVPTSVSFMRRELDTALERIDVPPVRRRDVALVLTEAAANVVVHAYSGGSPGLVYALAALTAAGLELDVYDRGHGMVPGGHSAGLGVGLALMSRLADGLDIAPIEGGGLRVTALFRGVAPPVVPPPPEPSRSERERDYVAALAETHAALREQTRALMADARDAVAHARDLRRTRITRPP